MPEKQNDISIPLPSRPLTPNQQAGAQPKPQRSGTIRTRLLLAFIGMAVAPLAITISLTLVTGFINGRQGAIDQLESASVLKQAEIQAWFTSLLRDLESALSNKNARLNAEIVLREQSRNVLLREELRNQLRSTLQATGSFDELFLLDKRGLVVLSTDASQEGNDYSQELVFIRGYQEHFVQPPYYVENQASIMAMTAQPILIETQPAGVLVGRVNLTGLNELMQRSGLGESGEIYLVGPDSRLLTLNTAGQSGIKVDSQGIRQAIQQHNGSSMYSNYTGVPVIGAYRWWPEFQMALLAEQAQAEAFRALYTLSAINVLIMMLSIGLAAFVARSIAHGISNPLVKLAETATQIAAGDLTGQARIERQDEVGALAQAFNTMTIQLRDLVGGLEQRVNERTDEIVRRSHYLEASAQVSRAAASILDSQQLIQQVVELIRQQFSLYYVGLFLLDEDGEWAILRAGTGEAGQRMLTRGHRIQVGKGMIGWSIAYAQPRIALDVGEDAVRLATFELPATRSEAALPLRSRQQVIGAISIQSEQPNAFDQDSLTVLQVMADQVAVALDNAQLLAQSQATLESMRRSQGELDQQAWQGLLQTSNTIGYRYDPRSILPADQAWRHTMVLAAQQGETIQSQGKYSSVLAVPIKIRDQVIGVLDAHKIEDSGNWTPEEIVLLEKLSDQVSVALESARLYQDTQRRAARERVAGDITARIRESLDIDTVLQTSLREIGQALDLAEVEVRLKDQPEVEIHQEVTA